MLYQTEMTRVQKPDDVPKVPHFVIVEFDTYVPYTGYENEPGGGGGKSVLPRIYVTEDHEVWERTIQGIERMNNDRTKYQPTKYVAYHVDGVASIETTINVNVEVGI